MDRQDQTTEPDDLDVDEIVASLVAGIAARRADGEYPAGLEEELEAEFVEIMRAVHRDEVGTRELRERLERVAASIGRVRADPPVDSRVPGGSAVHATVARLVSRHTNTLADGVRAMGAEMAHALHEVVRLFEVQREADERQLNEVVSGLIDRLAILDHLADAVVDLERRVAELERPG